MPRMKPGPDSVGIFAISQSFCEVAARACGLFRLEPTKVAEILKDRPSWFRNCWSLEVFTMFRAGNAGTIELIYTLMNKNGFYYFIFVFSVLYECLPSLPEE